MNEYFSVLPEEEVPLYAQGCNKCELCKQGSRIIWGEGQQGAAIMVLLDNPGAREDREGNPIICGTRQTLQNLSLRAGIKLNHLYITYVVKCRPRRSYNKKEVRLICIEYFYGQIAAQRPQVLLCLGNVAIQALLNDETAEVKQLRGQWHMWDNIPLVVSYHPLAVRRRPGLYPYALSDWEMVAEYIKAEPTDR